jgi:hypothetical protein
LTKFVKTIDGLSSGWRQTRLGKLTIPHRVPCEASCRSVCARTAA